MRLWPLCFPLRAVSRLDACSSSDTHTVDGQVAQGCARRSLHLDVGVLEQEEDRLQGVAIDFSNIYERMRLDWMERCVIGTMYLVL